MVTRGSPKPLFWVRVLVPLPSNHADIDTMSAWFFFILMDTNSRKIAGNSDNSGWKVALWPLNMTIWPVWECSLLVFFYASGRKLSGKVLCSRQKCTHSGRLLQNVQSIGESSIVWIILIGVFERQCLYAAGHYHAAQSDWASYVQIRGVEVVKVISEKSL